MIWITVNTRLAARQNVAIRWRNRGEYIAR
jgi:hypothetical protein